MKKILFAVALSCMLCTVSAQKAKKTASQKQPIEVHINLTEVNNDQVLVTVKAANIKTNEITYCLPKTVPGTYSEDNYGKFISDFKAYDSKGQMLSTTKSDENSWQIKKAKSLTKITYLVNDSFDTEKGGGIGKEDIFSPAGTNIKANTNFMLNLHGFVGYIKGHNEIPYKLIVTHPENLRGATSMVDKDAAANRDVFEMPLYSELLENPIMYSKPDFTTFNIDGMDIEIAVYSPTAKYNAQSLTPAMKTMMAAQKAYLGPINSTKKYSILIYLSTMAEDDAKGFGALEHPASTTVVMPEVISKEELEKHLQDIVSHEFFHIVTPLTIHSKEIQYFDYNEPKMSQHLWMYEGITEYFANLFQINRGLITEADFYDRISKKITNSHTMDDSMPFTTMSSNVLKEPYKSQYLNVYEKGALIGMCLDIIIREKSDGKRGVLDLMQKLSMEYGISKPFEDSELFAKVTQLTYPEVGEFLNKYVSGPNPIPYDEYLSKLGLSKINTKTADPIFINGNVPCLQSNPQDKLLIVNSNAEGLLFYSTLGIKNGDAILEINSKAYNLDNIYDLISESANLKENEPIKLKIKRDGKEQTIEGTVKLNYSASETLEATNPSKAALRAAWLKG